MLDINVVKEFKPFYRNSLLLADDITFGVEIEFEDVPINTGLFNQLEKYRADYSTWFMCDDHTITYNHEETKIGGELISPIMKDQSKYWHQLKKYCERLNDLGANITDFTGAHVHVGSQAIGSDITNIIKLLKLWELYEHVIFKFSYGEYNDLRSSARIYAKPIGKILNGRNIKKLKKYTDFKTFFDSFDIKSYCLDFSKFSDVEFDTLNTIEFRCPNGTLNPIVWQNNIDFFTHFLLATRKDLDMESIDFKLSIKSNRIYEINSFNKDYLDDVEELADIVFDTNEQKMNFYYQYLIKTKKFKNH